MLIDRGTELDGFEQLSRRTGENRDAVRSGAEVRFEEARDTLQIVVERLAFRRSRRICRTSSSEFLSDERVKLVPAGLTRLSIEIQTDNRIWRRLERREPVQLILDCHTE